MATLVIYPEDLSPPRLVLLNQRVLRIGAADDNDVHLMGAGVSLHHCHLVYDKGSFSLATTDEGAQFHLNAKRKRSAKLADGDVIRVGGNLLRFVIDDQTVPVPSARDDDRGQEQYFQALHSFSMALMDIYSVPDLLGRLLDQLIALSAADKAFLLLTSEEVPRVAVARNIDQSALIDPQMAISDSIVAEVLRTGKPLIVADALSHEDFKSSQSVVNLKLCSVMCVPLVARGGTLGLFYLGNDNAVNHFSESLLSVVSVFGSQAGLILSNALARAELERHVEELEQTVGEKRFGEIIGSCDGMRDIFKKISRVANTDVSVLIQGETGTGKELVARAIHERSNRAKGAFIVLNCGAIPENLLESELFGHVRGAFTGAVSSTEGRFQAASGGTIFLDEIGEMPMSLQVKLLRVIQERQVCRVGDTKVIPVDIRVVAATNKMLGDEVRSGAFREDLYYRLNVISLDLPPLRDRGEDILLIARYFLGRYAQQLVGHECTLAAESLAVLKRWSWPGNIRELENRIKKALIFADGGVIRPDHLDLDDGVVDQVLSLADAREDWQREYINKVLSLYDGNRTQTARALDVDPRTIFRHLERERTEP